MNKPTTLAAACVLAVCQQAGAVMIGQFPGLAELIDKADAVVILRVDDHLSRFGSPTLYSKHNCYIYQTLKGEIPAGGQMPLQLMDTRMTGFATPYANLSTHLMFLTKKRSPDEATEYRTIEYQGAQVLLPPLGHEKPPAGETTLAQVTSLLRRAAAHNTKLRAEDGRFIAGMLASVEGGAGPDGGAGQGGESFLEPLTKAISQSLPKGWKAIAGEGGVTLRRDQESLWVPLYGRPPSNPGESESDYHVRIGHRSPLEITLRLEQRRPAAEYRQELAVWNELQQRGADGFSSKTELSQHFRATEQHKLPRFYTDTHAVYVDSALGPELHDHNARSETELILTTLPTVFATFTGH